MAYTLFEGDQVKIRHGHVSNSSSSSFVVAFKGVNLSREERHELVLDVLLGGHRGIPAEAVIGPIVRSLLSLGFKERIQAFTSMWDTEREWCEANDCEYYESNVEKVVRKAINEGWTVGVGYAGSDSESSAEVYLRYSELDIQTDNIIIKVSSP